MDTVSIAAFLVQGQMSLKQGEIAAALVNRQMNVQDQMVSLIGEAVQKADVASNPGTGEYINIIA